MARSTLHRAANLLVRKMFSQHDLQPSAGYRIDPLESRLLLSADILGTAGADTISVDWNGNSIVINVNGSSSSYSAQPLIIDALGGNDTIIASGMPDFLLALHGGTGNDVINIGGGDIDAGFQNTISAYGEDGTDSIIFDDRDDLGLDDYDIAFTVGGSRFSKTNYSIGTYIDAGTENLTIQCNHASNEITIEARAGYAYNSISVQGFDGADSCTFNNIDATCAFAFNGGAGADVLNYHDQTFGGSSMVLTAAALDYGPNNLSWSATEEVEIEGSAYADTFNVNAVGSNVAVSVIGGDGDDLFSVGNGNIAANILGALHIIDFNGQGEGRDTVVYVDFNDTGDDAYTLKNGSGSLTKTGLANPIEAFVESYTLSAGSGNNNITVIPAGVINFNYTVHGGAGDDDITFGDGSIRGLQGNVIITGESGNDTLTIDDSAVEGALITAKDYHFGNGVIHYDVNGFPDFDITNSNIETVSLNAGPLDNNFDVSFGVGSATTVNLRGGEGNDTLLFTPFASAATINFDGGAATGTDTVVIDDSARSTSASYTLDKLLFDMTGLGLLTFITTDALTLNTGSAGDTIDIIGAQAGRTLLVNSGGGNDTIDIGGGDIDNTIAGTATISGGAGTDRIIFDDTADTGADTYQLAGGVFRKLNITTTIAYDTVENLEINGSAAANPFIISSPGSATSLIARGGAGADSYTITPAPNCTISIDASDPTTTPGDSLTFVNADAAGHCTFTPNGAVNGTYAFDAALPVSFLGVETFAAVPAAPSQPDLIAAHDSGISSSDNITNRRSFTLTGTAPASALVRVESGSTLLSTVTASAAGAFSASASFTSDGMFAITATAQDPTTGLRSAASAPLNVTIDTVAPSAPAAPDLDPSSDNGVSQTDNLTNDNTPLMTGIKPAATVVRLFNASAEVGADISLAGSTYAITSAALADGVRAMNCRFEDIAGNQSAAGPVLNVAIDTAAPAFEGATIEFTSPQLLRYKFNESLTPASVSAADLSLQNLTSGATVPASSIAASASTSVAIFTFPGFAGGILTDGSYRGTLAAGAVQDLAGNGNALAAAANFIWSDGGAAPDAYTIAVSADGLTVQVFQNSAAPTYTATRATLDAIGISTLAGNDSITVDLASASPIPLGGGIFIDGGGDIDTLAVLGTSAAQSAVFSTTAVAVSGGTIARPNIEAIQFDGRGGFDSVSIVGGPTVSFTATQHLQSLSLSSGTAASMLANGNNVLVTRALSLATTATLDLNDNDLVLDYTGASPIATIRSLIASARAGGAWTGTGLTSSAARTAAPANTTLGLMEATEYQSIHGAAATFDAEPLDASALLVKFTYYGDTDFNGVVNFDDYVRTDNGFNNHQSGWLNGDFDLNGAVNFDDYVLIDLAFNTQSAARRTP